MREEEEEEEEEEEGGLVLEPLKNRGRVDPFLTCPPFWRDAQVVRFEPEATGVDEEPSPICFLNTLAAVQ